jgi:hypothetical protein
MKYFGRYKNRRKDVRSGVKKKDSMENGYECGDFN